MHYFGILSSVAGYVRSRCAEYSFLFLLLLICDPLLALPTGDDYQATATNIVDSYQNTTVTFDGTAETPPTLFSLTSINESIESYDGVPGGVSITLANGSQSTISSWQNAGHIIEFTVSATDGNFFSLAPFSLTWSLELNGIDLTPAQGATPEVIGVYFDLTNSSQELAYDLDPFTIGQFPFGTAPHPLEPGNDVYYISDEGLSLGFGTITNNTLRALFDVNQFLSFSEPFSLENLALSLGVTNNIDQSPMVDTMKIGFLVTGIELEQPNPLPADFNRDQIVSAADYVLWRDNAGITSGATQGQGDADGDGDVDNEDYDAWSDSFGATSNPPAAASSSQSSEALVATTVATQEEKAPAVAAAQQDTKSTEQVTKSRWQSERYARREARRIKAYLRRILWRRTLKKHRTFRRNIDKRIRNIR